MTRTPPLWILLVALGMLVSGCVEESPPPASPPPAHPWQRHPDNPVIVPGLPVTPGGPRGLNVADASVLYDGEERKWKMWFATGWCENHTVPASGDCPARDNRLVIKSAESDDGIRWGVREGLALEPSAPGDWDFTNTETPSVVKNPRAPPEKRYMLWYSGGNTHSRTIGAGYPFYQIGLAFSADGRTFTRLPEAESPYGKAGLVLVAQDAFPAIPDAKDGVMADPDVVWKDGIYHMWFSSIGLTSAGDPLTAGISYATSPDGVRWTPSRKNPLPSLEREFIEFPAQPSVLWNPKKGGWEMWFTNDKDEERTSLPTAAMFEAALGYWYAFSTDGEEWTVQYRNRDFRWNRSIPSEELGLVTGTEVVLNGSEYRMYYNAFGTRGVPPGWGSPAVWAMNLATKGGATSP